MRDFMHLLALIERVSYILVTKCTVSIPYALLQVYHE